MNAELKNKVAEITKHADIATMHELLADTLDHLISINPRMGEELIERYDGSMNYNNYLTESEAVKILADFINQDGTHGAMWKDTDFFSKAESLGIKTEDAPHYNKWALYVTACAMVSNHLKTIEKYSGGDITRYVEFACDLAIEQLSDRDMPKWIRTCFQV